MDMKSSRVSKYRTILRHDITPIADSVPQNFEIISESLSTNQNSARGIYD